MKISLYLHPMHWAPPLGKDMQDGLSEYAQHGLLMRMQARPEIHDLVSMFGCLYASGFQAGGIYTIGDSSLLVNLTVFRSNNGSQVMPFL